MAEDNSIIKIFEHKSIKTVFGIGIKFTDSGGMVDIIETSCLLDDGKNPVEQTEKKVTLPLDVLNKIQKACFNQNDKFCRDLEKKKRKLYNEALPLGLADI